ncbi:MAG: PrsW family glutamic-type intramembrane protease [Candidatus Pacebacteria bacterium]|nr:PrsW family glutamic-type intramembrane protease [Candidatus Paceibacterota bacterium]
MSIVIALILGLLPSLAWLVFYLKEDPHPEPKKIIFLVFLAGMISTFIALGFQIVTNDWAIDHGIEKYSVLSFLMLGVIEEILKFGAAWIVALKFKDYFDEPVDAMIYMIVAALGFAAVENIAAAVQMKMPVIETTSLRFIGATLLHTLSSGLMGYYWAVSVIKNKKSFLLIGLFAATVFHTIFNSLIVRYEPLVIPVSFLIIYAMFILYDFEKLKKLQ